MSMPILATKLYIPPPRLKLVLRPRLIEQLNEGPSSRKLTLISAPAGFGKTTLVSEWIHAGVVSKEYGVREDCEPVRGAVLTPSFAWLSLDEGDNDPARFLVYLVAALQSVEASIGQGALSALQSPQPPPIEAVLTSLINEVSTISDRVILVLDDYHVIEAEPIDRALTFLLEHLPPQMYLVIATREDPPLPLARLRARGQLTELRAADLRFTPAEAAEFLNRVMSLNLSAEDIAALETRTEGWIAGLQMAAISMQGRADTAGFIRAFTGSHRFVMDYLVEEVLQCQPERVRSFLLQTAILSRLSGPLCDAVTRQEGGQGILEALERGNLFVIPLDDQRQWYRYHHLFADVLQAHLTEEQPNQAPALHRRASEWHEQNGSPADAIRHALAANDFERAADLIELVWPKMNSSFQSVAWLDWVKALPDELVRTRPVLSADYAQALIDGGALEAAEPWLENAERWLDTAAYMPAADMSERSKDPSTGTCPEPHHEAPPEPVEERSLRGSRGMVVVDKEQFRSLPATIAISRAYCAQALGNVSATVKYARLALSLTPEGDHSNYGGAVAFLGTAYWASGDLEAAYRTMADGINRMQKTGDAICGGIVGTYVLADIRVAQGRLHEAIKAYERSLQLASEYDELVVQRVTAHLHLGLAMLYHEIGDQKAAAQFLQNSKELDVQTALVDWPYRWRLAQARLREAQGDLDTVLDLLDEAKRLYVRVPIPDIRPIEALKAKVYIKQGRLTKALDWVYERGLSVDDELSYLREFEHITLARMLIAEYERERTERSIVEATGLLARLLKAAEEKKRTGSVIEILVLLSLAHQAQGSIPLALASLERALALAEPEGYVRVFVDEGLPMAQLLSEAITRGVKPDYTGKLLAVSKAEEKGKDESYPPPISPAQPLIEPLSQRELEILQLVAQGLSNREIGERLFLALSTVKGHNRNIYSKLQVKRRTEAVARARELGLL